MQRAYTHLPAPAKINWFLHVTGRYEAPHAHAGKHRLQSAMQLIDLQDTLHVEVTESHVIARRDTGETPQDMPADDLCVRAAMALQAQCGITQGCMITLEKRTPSGAGLGGGSSDAATTLLALNQLWACKLNDEQLASMALQLGADVPFFLRRLPAWVEGMGEALSDFQLPAQRLLIIKPQASVPTKAVYQHLALKRDTPEMIKPEPAYIARNGIDTLMSITENDLYSIAEIIAPEVALALELARAHARAPQLARMSGSGSAVFALMDELQPMITLPTGWKAWQVQTLEQHPLHQLLSL